jgi:hypothetical protein
MPNSRRIGLAQDFARQVQLRLPFATETFGQTRKRDYPPANMRPLVSSPRELEAQSSGLPYSRTMEGF